MTKGMGEAKIEEMANAIGKLVLRVETLLKEVEQLVEKLEVRVNEEVNEEYAALWGCPPTGH